MLRSVPLPHISSPPFTFSLLRIKSHNSCSALDLEYYAVVTKPLGRCGHGPLGRCGQCQWQHARCGHPLNWEASLHLMLIVVVYPCLAVVQFFCFWILLLLGWEMLTSYWMALQIVLWEKPSRLVGGQQRES